MVVAYLLNFTITQEFQKCKPQLQQRKYWSSNAPFCLSLALYKRNFSPVFELQVFAKNRILVYAMSTRKIFERPTFLCVSSALLYAMQRTTVQWDEKYELCVTVLQKVLMFNVYALHAL